MGQGIALEDGAYNNIYGLVLLMVEVEIDI